METLLKPPDKLSSYNTRPCPSNQGPMRKELIIGKDVNYFHYA